MSVSERASSVIAAARESAYSRHTTRKWPISYRSVGVIAVTTDIATILLCGIGSGVVYHFETFGITDVIPQYLGAAAVVAAFFVAVMKAYDLYNPAELLTFRAQASSVITIWMGVFLFLSGAVFALKIGDDFSRGAVLSFAALGLALLLAQRAFYRTLLIRGLEGRRFAGRNAILITDGRPAVANSVVPMLQRHGVQICAQVTHDKNEPERVISRIIDHVRDSEAEEIFISADLTRLGELRRVFASLRALPLPVNFVPVGPASDLLHRPTHWLGDAMCIEVQRAPLGTIERAIKRCLDVLGALTGLILLLPLLVMTAAMIKLDSPGPILFRQKRCGFNGRLFYIYKFRTMSVLEDGPTVNQAALSDSRVTRLGKWLRRTSIDELPQLLNVLGGSMSLVGPRPHALAHDSHFDKIVSNYAFRRHVKPGLTGWAQVNGHRGPTPTVADVRRRVEHDLYYIDNWSLRLDFVIMIRTVIEVMRARNAY